MEFEYLWLLRKAQELGFNINVGCQGLDVSFEITGRLSSDEEVRKQNLVAAGIDPSDFDFQDNFTLFSQKGFN